MVLKGGLSDALLLADQSDESRNQKVDLRNNYLDLLSIRDTTPTFRSICIDTGNPA